MGLDFESFSQLVDEIASQGYDQETAAHYASLIGDTPSIDDAGRVVVEEQGKELARLKPLKFFGD